MDLSVIVNFYNMRREAARTLASLSRSYQAGAQGLDYEVLCVDNGSDPPLEAAFVESFGPEFRLIRPERPHPSPVGPMNAAALEARGRRLAVMIDGAHLLTPGVVSAAMETFARDPEAVVGVRPWFVGGDQRWLSAAGYSREMEDELFEASAWPEDGYDLFRFGAPADGRTKPWLRRMAESNCLFLGADLYRRIGGYDERFDEPGAGMANLDLFKRAVEAAAGPAVVLLGEASFHQFHGGTTTNVAVDEKDRRVRDYMAKYEALKGEPYQGPELGAFEFRGAFRSYGAGLKLDKRPAFPRAIPLTDSLRPLALDDVFDADTRQHLQSVYAEAAQGQTSLWLGEPIALYPADLIAIQEILVRTRPTHVILVNTEPGLVRLADSVLGMLDAPPPAIIRVLETEAPSPPVRGKVVDIIGRPYAKKVKAQVEEQLHGAERTLVLFSVYDPTDFRVGQLATYSRFVTEESYLVVLRTVLGHPWIGYSRLRARDAVRELVRIDPNLVVDETWDRNVLTWCPSGFVRRLGSAPQPNSPAR